MNRYVIGNVSSGEILRSVQCESDQIESQVLVGEWLDLSDDATPETHYFLDAAIVAYSPEQAASKSQRPMWASGWDNGSMAWVDPRNLSQQKRDKWIEIKVSRDTHEFGGFTWDGSTFDSDRESQSRIQGAAQLATLAMLSSQQFSVDWTLADNTVRTLSGADMLAVGQQMGVHIMTTHATGRALRDATEAATTSEELGAITWPV